MVFVISTCNESVDKEAVVSYVPRITTPLPEVTKSVVDAPLSPSTLLTKIFGGSPKEISPDPSIVIKAVLTALTGS